MAINVGWPERDSLMVINYDTSLFKFREWFASTVGHSTLEELHFKWQVDTANYQNKVADFQSLCSGNFETLRECLNRFSKDIIEPIFGEIASRQPDVTFRSHFSVNNPVLSIEKYDAKHMQCSEFLRKHYFDNYRPGVFHRDKDYGLLAGTVNLWVPITDVFGANSLWIGGRNNNGNDAFPVSMKYGECLFFDGATRWHGAVWNTTATTRISFDTRFIPKRHLSLLRG